jgi:hypothetical protein
MSDDVSDVIVHGIDDPVLLGLGDRVDTVTGNRRYGRCVPHE